MAGTAVTPSKYGPPSVTWRALVSYVTRSRQISRDGHSPRVRPRLRLVYSIAHLAGGEEVRDYVVFRWQLLMLALPSPPLSVGVLPATNSPNLRQFRLAVSPPCYSPGFSPCLSKCQTANSSVQPTTGAAVWISMSRKTRFVARPPCAPCLSAPRRRYAANRENARVANTDERGLETDRI